MKVLVDLEASEDIQRYLDAIVQPWDHLRRLAAGRWWTRRRSDGVWITDELVEEAPGEVSRNGRRPDMVISGEMVDLFGRRRAQRASQGDIDDAMRGLRPTLVKDKDGNERIDYRVPLKNKDGSLSKYAKRLIDLHSSTASVEQEIGEKMHGVIGGD